MPAKKKHRFFDSMAVYSLSDPNDPCNFQLLPPPRPHLIPVYGNRSALTKPIRPTFTRRGAWKPQAKNVPSKLDNESAKSEEKADTTRKQLAHNEIWKEDHLNLGHTGKLEVFDYELVNGCHATRFVGGWEATPFEPITINALSRTKGSKHPRFEIQRNAFYYVRLEQIVDPSNFFMEFLIEPPEDHETWEEALQKFYSDPATAQKYKMRSLRPIVGQQYVYFNEDVQRWERVRVHSVNLKSQTVVVCLMDKLVERLGICFEELLEIHPRFANWHRYPLNGALRDVVPKQETSDFDYEEAMLAPWPEEVIEYFKSYVKEKLFHAFVVTRGYDRQDTLHHSSNETRFAKASVILFEVGGQHKFPVNALLCLKGYATEIRGMTDWKSMMQKFHGITVGGN